MRDDIQDLREASVDQASIYSEGSRGSSGSVGGGFGPCARCRNVITCEAEGCNALGENFHSSCFHCNRCGTQLVSKAFVHSSKYSYRAKRCITIRLNGLTFVFYELSFKIFKVKKLILRLKSSL